jgi:hypothetical protein
MGVDVVVAGAVDMRATLSLTSMTVCRVAYPRPFAISMFDHVGDLAAIF